MTVRRKRDGRARILTPLRCNKADGGASYSTGRPQSPPPRARRAERIGSQSCEIPIRRELMSSSQARQAEAFPLIGSTFPRIAPRASGATRPTVGDAPAASPPTATARSADRPMTQPEDADRNLDFDALVAKYEKKIFNVIYRFLGDYEEATDLTQETFHQRVSALMTAFGARPKSLPGCIRLPAISASIAFGSGTGNAPCDRIAGPAPRNRRRRRHPPRSRRLDPFAAHGAGRERTTSAYSGRREIRCRPTIKWCSCGSSRFVVQRNRGRDGPDTRKC